MKKREGGEKTSSFPRKPIAETVLQKAVWNIPNGPKLVKIP
jgi:hypothetical protein